MHNFLQRLQYRLSHLLQGRYGVDQMLMPLVILSCALTLCSSVFGSWVLRLLGSLVLLYAIFRIFSGNDSARRKELQWYLAWRNKTKTFFNVQKTRFRDRKIKKYFKCPNCKTTLFVPRGKGKLQITCRNCQHRFVKKS